MGTRVPKHLTSTVRTLHSAYLLKTRCVKYSLVLSNSELRNEPSEMSSGALATMESCGRGREGGREEQVLIHVHVYTMYVQTDRKKWTGIRPSTTIYGGLYMYIGPCSNN